MGAVYFYHLTRTPLEKTLPVLLEKSLSLGWWIELRGRDRAAMERLDAQLWLGPEDRFLPHGLAGGPHDADQPVLLTCGEAAANRPSCVMSVEGAEVSPEEAQALERACILFDGQDGAAVSHARDQWRRLTGAGCSAQYWSQESGRWEKKSER